MLLLYFVAVGLLLGRLTGGRFDRLGSIRFRWGALAVAGLAVQLALFSPPVASVIGGLGPPLYVGSTLAVLVALLPNIRLPGFPLILCGALSNLAAILANGGLMPASPEAFARVYGEATPGAVAFTNSVLADSSTRLAFLGDVFWLPPPIPLANVFSIGDVLIGLGAAWFLVRTMHAPGAAAPTFEPQT
jgi:hypothetical protein